jgi:hypothetical protein
VSDVETWQFPDVSSAFISGVVDKLYGHPRMPPSDLDDEESAEWLLGWDA